MDYTTSPIDQEKKNKIMRNIKERLLLSRLEFEDPLDRLYAENFAEEKILNDFSLGALDEK